MVVKIMLEILLVIAFICAVNMLAPIVIMVAKDNKEYGFDWTNSILAFVAIPSVLLGILALFYMVIIEIH